MTIEIEKGIPMPEPINPGGGGKTRYPWTEMDIGDSFLVPDDVIGRHFKDHARDVGKRLGCKFQTRTINGRVRCWRTA